MQLNATALHQEVHHHEKPLIFLWIAPRNLPMFRSILLKIFRSLKSIIMSFPPFCLNARVLQLPYSVIYKRHPWSYLCVIATGDTFKWFQYYYFNLNGCIRQESSSSICMSSHFKRPQCATICAATANSSHYAQWHPSCCFLKQSQSYSSILSLLFINVSAVPIPLLCKCNFQRSPSLRINYLHNARSFSVSSAFRTR